LNYKETLELKVDDILKGLLKKVTILLLRIQKGIKILINTLKIPNLATMLQN
jgi:hypothetical protein